MQNKNYPRVQIIINADSNADIQESVGWLSGAVHQSATEYPSESPATKVNDSQPAHIKAQGTPPTDIIAEKSESDKKQEESTEKASAVTLDDLRKKMSAVLKSGQRDEAKALLAEFEAPKLGELAPEKYEAMNRKLDALLGGA